MECSPSPLQLRAAYKDHKPALVSSIEIRSDADVNIIANGNERTTDDLDVDSDRELGDGPTRDTQPSRETKSRLQSTIFKAWAVREAATDLKKRKRAPKDASAKTNISISEILGQQEASQIIENPRDYQLELFERAKAENTIAVLDTGTGKTLIAVLLLRYIMDQELEDRLRQKSPRVAFFLAPSVNLVFQQYAVLEANLDHPIARVVGSMRVDLWSRERWATLFAAHRIIVCTADVLLKCLGHGLIRMDQINLLVFDEAHHAKLQHAYGRIMRDYYATLDDHLRPRVFGMTASPVDIKALGDDVLQAAENLETTLHSRIATTMNLAALQTSVHRPHESVKSYTYVRCAGESPLTVDLRARFARFPFFNKLALKSSEMNVQLGTWCADMFWKMCLVDKIEDHSDNRLEAMAGLTYTDVEQSARDQDLEQLKGMFRFVDRVDIGQPDNVSPKVQVLLDVLKDSFGHENNSRCIVFVEQRYTARLLAALCQSLDLPHLRAGALVGSSSQYFSTHTTFRDQVLALVKFRNGTLNCLFATSVAEEGLDVPDCNLIIRFDRCKTMIQYIQSRGRARHKNSRLVHIMEYGNRDHRMLLNDNAGAEMIMRRFCSTIPKDRLLVGDEDLQHVAADSSIVPMVMPETGAKLTASNCISILSEYCSTLDNKAGDSLRPTYVVHPASGGFICEIVLPLCSPIRGQVGFVQPRKLQAKCSAAFKVCSELIRAGHLDKNMLPTSAKRLRMMANAKLGQDMYEKKGGLMMRHKPDFWMRGIAAGSAVQTLHGIHIDFSQGLDQSHQAIVLLCRHRIPELPEFPLFLSSGKVTLVRIRMLQGALQVDDAMLSGITTVTLTVFKDVFNKTFEEASRKMPYWLLPANRCGDDSELAINDLVDWAAVTRCSERHGPSRWFPTMPVSALIGKFLVDPFHGGKRYFTHAVAEHLKPGDADPYEKAAPEKVARSIIENTVSLYKKSKARATWNMNQPVLLANKVLPRRNFLATATSQELEQNEENACCICPQPLHISAISAEFAASALVVPAVIYRIEAMLVALEGCEHIKLNIEPSLALEAFTKDSNGVSECSFETADIEYQPGMGRNYERLELYGDTFLKMTTTIATYVNNPADTEYDFHVKRMLQLCNRNLYEVSLELNLPQFIRTKAFDRRTWYPAGVALLAGRGSKANAEPQAESLGKKVLADVSEALIGAALCSHNQLGAWTPESWQPAVQAVTTLIRSETHTMMQWADYAAAYNVPAWQSKPPRASELYLADKVSGEHEYDFQNVRLLQAAFTHPSMPTHYEDVKSYQQLEFLGDSLYDMACVSHLFYNFADKEPAWLTEHKMAMVSNQFLSALCVKLGFHRHIRHQSSPLVSEIKQYCLELAEAEESSKSSKAMDYWTAVKDPPKALADVVEAYIGALFLDSGFSYSEVERFFNQHVLPFFEKMNLYDAYAHGHPVTRLHKLLQGLGCQEYKLMVEEMPANADGRDEAVAGVVIHNEVIGGDKGHSSRYAKVRAAAKALAELAGLPLSVFRMRFGCDCHTASNETQDVTMSSVAPVTMATSL